MRVLYLIRAELHIYPPCLSQILYLNELCVDVTVAYGGCDEKVKTMLENKGIKCVDLQINRNHSSSCELLLSIAKYRRQVSRFLKEHFHTCDLLWFGTADSGFLVRARDLKDKNFVLSVLELYDKNKLYLKGIGRIICRAAAVICCERTRADIMRCWWELKETPFVMPNKPYAHPNEKNMAGTIAETSEIIKKFGSSFGIIYQGIFSKDRDLSNLACALKELEQDIVLYLMGSDPGGYCEKIKTVYEKTVYLGYVPAPFHLEVTSHAQVGIALYDYSSLNNLFCAPNKIYEYAGFGIPIIGNDVHGLRETIGKYEAGICVNFDSVDEIKDALLRIMNDYERYSENAKEFYLSTDNRETVRIIVNKLNNLGQEVGA